MQFMQEENTRLINEVQVARSSTMIPVLEPGSFSLGVEQPLTKPMDHIQSLPLAKTNQLDNRDLEDPQWEFCREFFPDLSANVKEIYQYEATIHHLGCNLWPKINHIKEFMLSGPLLKAQTKVAWEQCKLDNPR